VKDKYPDCKLTVVGNPINKEVVSGNKDIDEYVVYESPKKLFKILKQNKYDFVCMTSPDFLSTAFSFLAKVKTICVPFIENGYSPYENIYYKLVRKLVATAPHKMGEYAPREYLRLLELINIFSEDTKKHLFFSEESLSNVEKYLNEQGITESDIVVCISPSAGNKIKNWPADRFSQVADYLYEKHKAKIVIIGSGRDKEEVGDMIGYLSKETKVYSTLEMFSVGELKVLISKMNLFIGVDTGPVYIAEAFGTPTIDIVGPMDENEQPPVGEKNRVVVSPNRDKPELHIMNARVYNKKEAIKQTLDIEVEMVIKEIDILLKNE
jgi:ADP-heptose:LPS heptosyltransferase